MTREQQRRADALRATVNAVADVAAAQRRVETGVARAAFWGATWAEIAVGLGVTTQAAHKRFRHVRYDPVTRNVWTETQLPFEEPRPNKRS